LRGRYEADVDVGCSLFVCECGTTDAEGAAPVRRAGRVAADTAARGAAALLVDHLSGRGAIVPDPNPALTLRFAARSDVGAAQ
jgi:hypothetical protein